MTPAAGHLMLSSDLYEQRHAHAMQTYMEAKHHTHKKLIKMLNGRYVNGKLIVLCFNSTELVEASH